VRRPPASPAPCPNPGPATGADHRRGHTGAPEPRSGHIDPTPSCAAGPGPPPTPLRRPAPGRAQSPRSRCGGRHPTPHAIASHCARRCSLPWFLTFHKPETLSHNDVRPSDQQPAHGSVTRASNDDDFGKYALTLGQPPPVRPATPKAAPGSRITAIARSHHPSGTGQQRLGFSGYRVAL
jgi:hypothetical protein